MTSWSAHILDSLTLQGLADAGWQLTLKKWRTSFSHQVGALNAFLDFHDMALNHIKVHGALAGMVAEDADLMVAVGRVCQQYDVGFFGFAGTEHEAVCQKMGIKFVPELYVDLNYAADGSLIILRKPVTTDPEKSQRSCRSCSAR